MGTPIPVGEQAYFKGMLSAGLSFGALATLAADTRFNTENIGPVGL